MSFDFLPKELESMIMDYKNKMERLEDSETFLETNMYDILPCGNFHLIFIRDLNENGYSKEVQNAIAHYKVLFPDLSFTDEEVYLKIIKKINPDDIFLPFWGRLIGSDYLEDGRYANIENLPLDFLKTFRTRINWRPVGTGSADYTKAEDLPMDFIKEFANEIPWYAIKRLFKGKQIDDLPIEILRAHRDNIDWEYIGSGIDGNRNIHNLSVDFVREFTDKLNWQQIIQKCNYKPLNPQIQVYCPVHLRSEFKKRRGNRRRKKKNKETKRNETDIHTLLRSLWGEEI